MAEKWAARTGVHPEWEIDPPPHPHEAAYLKLDCSRARALLHWQPAFRLADALDRIVEWYEQWHAGSNMQQCTFSQIAAYQQLCARKGSTE